MDTICYELDGKLYINLTNRCSNDCSFCVRNGKDSYFGNKLWLSKEPTAEEVLAAIADYNYDSSESGKSTYYYVYGPDEYSSYGYQIVVEDGKVTSLRARQADINW